MALQRWYDVGPTSQTLSQHWTGVDELFLARAKEASWNVSTEAKTDDEAPKSGNWRIGESGEKLRPPGLDVILTVPQISWI